MQLTPEHTDDFNKSFELIRHTADAESKNETQLLLLWIMTQLRNILFVNGVFKKPSLFKRGKLVLFAIQLAIKVPHMIQHKKPPILHDK